MPNLRGLRNTCSMSELGLFSSDLPLTVERVKKWLKTRKAGYFDEVVSVRQSKAILCNTINHEELLQKVGFKTIARYKGNDRGIVNVMLYLVPSVIIKDKKK